MDVLGDPALARHSAGVERVGLLARMSCSMVSKRVILKDV